MNIIYIIFSLNYILARLLIPMLRSLLSVALIAALVLGAHAIEFDEKPNWFDKQRLDHFNPLDKSIWSQVRFFSTTLWPSFFPPSSKPGRSDSTGR